MTELLIIAAVVVWWVNGVLAIRWHWRREWGDLYMCYPALQAFVGILGPLAWLIGFWVHRKR
jgi:hypothetical protein